MSVIGRSALWPTAESESGNSVFAVQWSVMFATYLMNQWVDFFETLGHTFTTTFIVKPFQYGHTHKCL